MTNCIDGFVFPISRNHLAEYKSAAEIIAEIWKEHGALGYFEYVGEGLKTKGTRTFLDAIDAKEDEVVIFGWVSFGSKEARDLAHERVAEDPRMTDLVAPLVAPSKMIFDATRMAYDVFHPLILSPIGVRSDN